MTEQNPSIWSKFEEEIKMTEQSSNTTPGTSSTAKPQEEPTQKTSKKQKENVIWQSQGIINVSVVLFMVLFALYFYNQLSSVKNQLSSLKEEIADLKKQHSEQKKEVDYLKEQTSDLKLEVAGLNEYFSDPESNLNVLDTLVQRVEKLENFVDQVDNVKQKLKLKDELGKQANPKKQNMATQGKTRKSKSGQFLYDDDDFLPF
jgi:cell division protein FtsB